VRRTLTLVACLSLVAAACGDDDEGAAAPVTQDGETSTAPAESTGESGAAPVDRPTIVVTTSIWADIVRSASCDGLAEIVTLIPVGADPHDFEPSLRDREVLAGADLVIANGLDLEETLLDTIDSVAADGVPVWFVAEHVADVLEGGHHHGDDEHGHGDAAEKAAGAHDHDHGDDEHGHGSDVHDDEHGHDDEAAEAAGEHDHEGGDPHVWHDPRRVAGVLGELGETLVTSAGLEAAAVDACVEATRSDLETLDAELEQRYTSIPAERRLLVTNHDSLAYLADRYGLTVVGSVIPSSSSLAETNPADLQALADEIARVGAPAVFAETQGSASDAEALAAQVGVPVVTLWADSLGEPGSGAETYTGMLRSNADLIVAALTP
jgi:zinc/manganese transport system substrate-binding protein